MNPQFLSATFSTNGERVLRQRLDPADIGMGADLPPATTYRLIQSIKLENGRDWGGEFEGGKIGFGLSVGTAPTGKIVDMAGFSAR
jgi:hypothetical protein